MQEGGSLPALLLWCWHLLEHLLEELGWWEDSSLESVVSKYTKSCPLSELLLMSLEKAVALSQVQIFEMFAEGSGARTGSTLLCSPV